MSTCFGCSDVALPTISTRTELTADDAEVLRVAVTASPAFKVWKWPSGELTAQDASPSAFTVVEALRVCEGGQDVQRVECLPRAAHSAIALLRPSADVEFLTRTRGHVSLNPTQLDLPMVSSEKAFGGLHEWWAVVAARQQQLERPTDIVQVTLPVYGSRTAALYVQRLTGRNPAFGWVVRLSEREGWKIDAHTPVWTSHPEG